MTTNATNKTQTAARQSTYSLLVRSEEKANIFETVIYALFILCAVVGVWQFVQQQPVPVLNHISNEEPTLAINVCEAGTAGC